jgi:hypothetical protein
MKHTIIRRACTALLLALVGTGCAAPGMTPSASVTTAIQGWEHYFRLEWAPQAKRDGIEIDGYVYNNYGSPMGNVQVLAQALDASNNVVAQKLEWVPGVVPPFNRSYFRVPGLPPAHQYRVSVWAFDVIDTDSFPRRRF